MSISTSPPRIHQLCSLTSSLHQSMDRFFQHGTDDDEQLPTPRRVTSTREAWGSRSSSSPTLSNVLFCRKFMYLAGRSAQLSESRSLWGRAGNSSVNILGECVSLVGGFCQWILTSVVQLEAYDNLRSDLVLRGEKQASSQSSFSFILLIFSMQLSIQNPTLEAVEDRCHDEQAIIVDWVSIAQYIYRAPRTFMKSSTASGKS